MSSTASSAYSASSADSSADSSASSSEGPRLYAKHKDLPNYDDIYEREEPKGSDIPKKIQKVFKVCPSVCLFDVCLFDVCVINKVCVCVWV
jgi:hypothetical protein